MKYKYIFFDFDGTLTNTYEGVAKILDMTLEHYGVTIEKSRYTEFIGPPLSDTFATLFGKDKVAEAVTYFKDNYFSQKAIYMTKVYNGIRACLKTLKKLGYIVGVATCKIQEEAEELLDYFNLNKYIDIVSGLCYNVREQKSDILSFAMEKLKADKSECLMIGDTIFDVEGAEIVGIDCVLCLWGFGDFDNIHNKNIVLRAGHPRNVTRFIKQDKNDCDSKKNS